MSKRTTSTPDPSLRQVIAREESRLYVQSSAEARKQGSWTGRRCTCLRTRRWVISSRQTTKANGDVDDNIGFTEKVHRSYDGRGLTLIPSKNESLANRD